MRGALIHALIYTAAAAVGYWLTLTTEGGLK